MPQDFQVISLNVWALKPISKFRPQRLRAIATKFLHSHADIDVICIQELWVYDDFLDMQARLEGVWGYGKFFFTGALGSGLAIFSKWPITSSLTFPYPLTGRPLGFSDFFVNKAAGSVVIEHPSLGEVEVFTTHMHAGGPEGYELGNSYRSTQAWRLASEAKRAASQGRYAIVCGDFNIQSDELPYAVMRDHGQLSDAWLISKGLVDQAEVKRESRDVESSIAVAGMTVDSPVNTWTHGKKIPAEVQRTFGKRLDYIWYRPPALPPRWSSLVNSLAYTSTSSPPYPSSSASNNPDPNQHQHRHLHLPTLTCTETEVVLTEVVPNEEYSYSDHFGLRAKFSIEHAFPSSSDPSLVADHPHASSSSPLEDTSAPMTAYGSGESGTSSTPLHQPRFTESQLRNKTLETLQTVEALIRHHRKAHLPHANHLFALVPVAILLLLALTTSTAFLPNHAYYSPLFVFAAGAVGFGGCTALITGFVWGRWEDRTLRRVEEEIREEVGKLLARQRKGSVGGGA